MRYGIIGAMPLEVELLTKEMNIKEIKEIAGVKYHIGEYFTNEVVIATSGIGKVNAAMCTQIMISEFKVEALINTGVAGAIDGCLNVGDIVISTDCVQHDFDCTPLGFAHGHIPMMDESVFAASNMLIDASFNSSKAVVKNHETYKGRIVSGDQFVACPDRKNFIENTFKALTTEMEGASIAHVCSLNKVPFVIIRSMSDKADGSAHVSFEEFAVEAAGNSSNIVLDMLSK